MKKVITVGVVLVDIIALWAGYWVMINLISLQTVVIENDRDASITVEVSSHLIGETISHTWLVAPGSRKVVRYFEDGESEFIIHDTNTGAELGRSGYVVQHLSDCHHIHIDTAITYDVGGNSSCHLLTW